MRMAACPSAKVVTINAVNGLIAAAKRSNLSMLKAASDVACCVSSTYMLTYLLTYLILKAFICDASNCVHEFSARSKLICSQLFKES